MRHALPKKVNNHSLSITPADYLINLEVEGLHAIDINLILEIVSFLDPTSVISLTSTDRYLYYVLL